MSRLGLIACGTLAGILALLWWPAFQLPVLVRSWLDLGAAAQLLTILLFLGAIVLLRHWVHARELRGLGLFVLAFVLGGVLAALQVAPALEARIQPATNDTLWRLTGRIASLPEPIALRGGGQGQRFELVVEQAQRVAPGASAAVVEPNTAPRRVRLSLYPAREESMRMWPALGERWQIEARLFAPRGAVNPAGFDYERWLFQRDLQATGTWVSGQRLAPAAGIAALRSHLYQALTASLPAGDARAVLQALVIGERGEFDDLLWDSLRRTGTSHLVAISGLHVGLLAALGYVLVAWGWRRSARLCLWLAAPRAAALAALVLAALYAALAGFAIPTQRALWMLSVVLLAQFSRYRMHVVDVLAVALLGVLLMDVRAVLAIGFWLSFAAVALIAFFLQPARTHPDESAISQKHRLLHPVVTAMRIQFGLTLGMLPLLLFWFGQVSWSAPLVNLLAVPLVGWLVVPLALLGSGLLLVWPALGGWILRMLEVALGYGLQGLHWVADSAWSMSGAQSWSALPSLLLLLALLLLWWGWQWRRQPRPRALPKAASGVLPGLLSGIVSVGLLLAALWLNQPETLAPDRLQLRIYDLGRGYAVSLERAQGVWLIDAGLRSGPHFDSGRDVIVPALRERGIQRVEGLWLTADRGDHRGGLPGLLQGLEVGKVVPPADCVTSAPTQLGVASPFTLYTHATNKGGVCVLELRMPGQRVVFSGAAPALNLPPPITLQSPQGAGLRTILVFSGHGKSAMQWPHWVATLQPQYRFIARGRPRVREAPWPLAPPATATTAQAGMLELQLESTEVHWRGWRAVQPQLWRWSSAALGALTW